MSRNPGAEGCSPFCPGRIVFKNAAIIFQGRATGRAIGDNEFHTFSFIKLDIVLCLVLHQVKAPVAQGRHPAADSFPGGDDGAAVTSQNAHAGSTLVGEHQALGAAEEESYPVLALA